MKIILTCPAPKASKKGNRVTAERWARLLRSLGYKAEIVGEWTGEPCDVLVALHALKSHASLKRFRRSHPNAPAILALTGTDLYRDLERRSAARESLALADRLVTLHSLAEHALPAEYRSKARVIYQSIPRRASADSTKKGELVTFLVSGHLRSVKDPMRTYYALRRLPPELPIRVRHIGAATTPQFAKAAERAMRKDPRYSWIGEVSHRRALQLLKQAHALVISSRLEGGANVVSEAIVLGTPVLASRIEGNLGLLGTDYPATFPVGDSQTLAHLMRESVEDPKFLAALRNRLRSRQQLFRPEREKSAWAKLLRELRVSR